MMQTITPRTLEELAAKSAVAPRRRCNLNMHGDLADPIQRMINAGHPGSYVRPHRHGGGRWESFALLQGAVAVLCFDDAGKVTERVELRAGSTLVAEIPGGVWHAIAFLEPGSAVFEIKPGPYQPATDKDFAIWAPDENVFMAAAMEAWLVRAQVGESYSSAE